MKKRIFVRSLFVFIIMFTVGISTVFAMGRPFYYPYGKIYVNAMFKSNPLFVNSGAGETVLYHPLISNFSKENSCFFDPDGAARIKSMPFWYYSGEGEFDEVSAFRLYYQTDFTGNFDGEFELIGEVTDFPDPEGNISKFDVIFPDDIEVAEDSTAHFIVKAVVNNEEAGAEVGEFFSFPLKKVVAETASKFVIEYEDNQISFGHLPFVVKYNQFTPRVYIVE